MSVSFYPAIRGEGFWSRTGLYTLSFLYKKKKKNMDSTPISTLVTLRKLKIFTEQDVVWNGDTMNQTEPLILRLLNFKVMIFFWWQADLNLNSDANYSIQENYACVYAYTRTRTRTHIRRLCSCTFDALIYKKNGFKV